MNSSDRPMEGPAFDYQGYVDSLSALRGCVSYSVGICCIYEARTTLQLSEEFTIFDLNIKLC